MSSTSRARFSLDGLQVACGTMGMPTATVRLRDPQGELHVHASVGTGPVDAAYRAIDGIVGCPNMLQEFVVHAVTEGIDALGEVTVRIQGENPQPVPRLRMSSPSLHVWRLWR
jgi:2-isopropylmalate synthase